LIAFSCPGGDLLSYLRRIDRPLSLPETQHITRQILEAVAFLHDRGIAHRDLKLQNVLVATPFDEDEDEEDERGRGRGVSRTSSRETSLSEDEEQRELPATTVEANGQTFLIPPAVIPPRRSSLPPDQRDGNLPADQPAAPREPNPLPRSSTLSATLSPTPSKKMKPKSSTDPPSKPPSPFLSITPVPFLPPAAIARLTAGEDSSSAKSLSPNASPKLYPTPSTDEQKITVKLTDFGFATVVSSSSPPTTQPDFRFGTPRYMAPEVILPTSFTEWDGREADCWAVGVILFALLFERYPFDGKGEKELEEAITMGDVVGGF
jgi:serine/threonine protein kinase